jgi:hypothetical protein
MMQVGTHVDAPVKSPVGWHLLGGLLVAAWIAVMGVMFIKSAGTGDALELSAADFTGRLQDEDSWLGAYSQGRKLGYVHSQIRAKEGAYSIEQHTFLKMRLAGITQEITSRFSADLGGDFQLKQFKFQFRSGVLSARADGRMQGKRLEVNAQIGSETSLLVLPLDAPPLFDLTVMKLLAARELKAGERYRVLVFDPQSLSNRPVVIEVVGLEVVKVRGEMEPSVHLRRTLAGQQVDTWIDARGAVLQEKTAFGLDLRREEPEAAQELPPDDQAGEIDATELLRLLAPASPGAKEEK